MQQIILAEGPPVLTQQAADAALDAIDFIAAAVRGYDAIDVTDVLRPIWRRHLASWYSHLDPPTRLWYANAPLMLATIQAQWPLLDPWQRTATLQQWAMALPSLLWMLDPVLAEAQATEALREQILANLSAMRQEASRSQQAGASAEAAPSQPATADPEIEAIGELSRRSQMTEMFRQYSTQMTASTINLMRAINPRP
jgi:hypothetical protein